MAVYRWILKLKHFFLMYQIGRLITVVFLVTNLCFFLSGYDNTFTSEEDAYHSDVNVEISALRPRHLLGEQVEGSSGTNWNRQVSHDHHKERIMYEDLRRTANCSAVLQNQTWEYMASGWTKAVYSGSYRGTPAALKTVDVFGHDITGCLQTGSDKQSCIEQAEMKITRELYYLRILKHDNIVELYDYCIQHELRESLVYSRDRMIDSSMVSMVTELGTPLDLIQLLQMSWEDRLHISLSLTRLITYLAHSPLGSLVLNDFRRQQFVLVGGELKLTDLDDVGLAEPNCISHQQCHQHFSNENITIRGKCVKGLCIGHNEKVNIHNAARHFTSFLLSRGAPPGLSTRINTITEAYNNVTMTTRQLLRHLEEVVDIYRRGAYLDDLGDGAAQSSGYRVVPEHDLAGLFDYTCRYSTNGAGCIVSVYDHQEAELLCNQDQNCQAFVLTQHKTWTGHVIAHLKNGVGVATINKNTTLYVKQQT